MAIYYKFIKNGEFEKRLMALITRWKKIYGDKKLWSNFSQICLNIKKLRKWHMMVAGLVAFKLPHPHPPGLIPL
jgi:hypothetical protein